MHYRLLLEAPDQRRARDERGGQLEGAEEEASTAVEVEAEAEARGVVAATAAPEHYC